MNAWQITRKDLRLLWRDRRTLAILVVLPLVFITTVGITTGQMFALREKAKKINVGVVNQDPGMLSQMVISEAEAMEALVPKEFPDVVAARKNMEQGEFDVIVIIGPSYTERVQNLRFGDCFTTKGRLRDELESLDVRVEASPLFADAKEIVEKLVYSFAYKTFLFEVVKRDKPSWATIIKRETVKIENEYDAATSGQEEAPQQQPALRQARPRMHVYQIIVPAYTVMFVYFILNLMARSMIAERDIGTLSRLRMAPVTNAGLIVGKTLPFFLVSVVQTSLLLLAGKLFFGMSWGVEPFALVPVIVCTSLSAVSLGLLVATTARTDSQVSAYGTSLVLILAAISGCLLPRQWQSELMQQIGLLTPHAWALTAYDQLLTKQYPEFGEVWKCCLVLLGFTTAFFSVGWWRFRTLE
jgi:ABC-2 type transport system permease protein